MPLLLLSIFTRSSPDCYDLRSYIGNSSLLFREYNMIHVLFLLLSENIEFLKCHVRGEKRRIVSQEANVSEM